MTQVNISVVVPCHGKTPYLKEAVDSVMNQDYKDFEMIIILDRPSSETLNMLETIVENQDKIKVFTSSTPGISAALNLGISKSQSDFIARLDVDDLMLPNRLREQINMFNADSQLVCVGSQISIMDSAGNFVRNSHFPTNRKDISNCLKIRNVIAHPSVMLRRSSLLTAGLYRSECDGAEDYDLWFRLSKIGYLTNLQEPLTKYRIHEGQITKRNSATQQKLDNSIREENLQTTTSVFTLKSSKEINAGIGSAGLERLWHFLISLFWNPIQFLRFVRHFVIPELRNPR